MLRMLAIALTILLSSAVEAEVVLCGDTDLDGLFETEDIQQCVDGLSGPGPHVVRLIGGTVFEPHVDTPPFYNSIGFVELDSDTTLDCQGSAIRGIDDVTKRAPTAWGGLFVVTNSDHWNDSQSEIWVRDCEIDGGMPASYDEDTYPFDNDAYMGFALYGVSGGGLVNSHVHDTHHACVYIKNSQDIDIDDNLFEDCGAANNLGNYAQPAVYLFQEGQTVQERISVRRNRAVSAGTALYNTRISQFNAEFQSAWMRDILFEDNVGDQLGGHLRCMMIRGVRGIVIRGNTCSNSTGISTASHPTAYCSDNPATPVNRIAESYCLQNVLIEDNLLTGSTGSESAAITIYDYQDGLTLRRNRIRGTTRSSTGPAPCLSWQTPLRDFQVDGLCALDCADQGVEQHSLSQDQAGVPANEHIVLKDIVVLRAGAEGVLLRRRLEALTVDRLAVRSTLGVAFRVLGKLVAPILTGLDILEGPPLPEWTSEVCPPEIPAMSGSPWRVILLLALVGFGVLRLTGPRIGIGRPRPGEYRGILPRRGCTARRSR